MRKKSSFFRKLMFLVAFMLVFNSFDGSANTSDSTYLNESENLTYEIITETTNESNTNLINCTDIITDNPEILTNEILDNEKLNKNSSLWSENILSLAAFLTSIVSLLTLNELRKQRHLANTPKLHIISPKNSISVKSKNVDGVGRGLPIEWKSENLKKYDNYFLPSYTIPLKIINTGSSPALNVKISWNFDFESIKDTLEQFNELELGVKCEISKLFEIDFLDFYLRNQKISDSMFLKSDNIDYILPFSNLNSETEISIPKIFSTFIILSLSVLGLSKNKYKYPFHSFDVEIEYYDNINLLHKENYSIEFEIIQLTWGPINTGTDEETGEFEEAVFSVEAHKVNGEKLAQSVEIIKKRLFRKTI